MPNSPNASPVAAGLVQRVARGVRYAVTGVGPNDWFGPAQPMAPMAQEQVGRVLDYRVGYNLSLRPREDEAVGFNQLRALADACNFLRLVIETRKDQMERLSWAVQPRLGSHISNRDPCIAAATNFLRRPDGHNSWATWLRQVLEELLVTDAVALYRRRNAGGQLYGLQQIDGATIKRIIDEAGLTPAAPDPAYQQILHGLPAVDYTVDQLLYLPRNPRIHKLYGYSPVEQVVMTVNIALRRSLAQLSYFTQGNIPEALVSCPPDWRPAQIREMQEIFDDMLRGDLSERSGAKFVPGATAQYSETRDGNGRDTMAFGNGPVTAVTSVVVGGSSILASAGWPQAGYSFDASTLYLTGSGFTPGRRNVQLAYTAGYATIPADVAQACIELVGVRYKLRDKSGLVSEGAMQQTTAYSQADMPASVKAAIAPYRRVFLT